MKATIYDVAKLANTSIATVSYVLNNSRRVRKATAERVQQAITKLNYQPKASAQALARGQTLTITLIAPLSIYSYQASLHSLIGGIGEILQSTDYRLYIHPTLEREGALMEIEAAIRSHQMDGVILMHVEPQDPRVELLRRSEIPFALIGRCDDCEGLTYVDADVEAVIDLAVKHLLELDHRKIGMFGERGKASITHRLVTGFKKSILSSGLTFYEEFNVEFADDPNEMDAVISQVLSSDHRPSAVFAVSDLAVLGTYKVAGRLGLRIPTDLAVIGYADSPIYPFLSPPCSAAFSGARDLGKTAAELLLAKLVDNSEEPAQILIPPQLIARESTEFRP